MPERSSQAGPAEAPDAAPGSKVYVIQNPAAGGRHPERLRRIIGTTLEARGVSYQFAYTEAPGHAEELAAAAVASGFPRVLVAGGDGTVMEAVASIADTDTVLGLIPTGTGNQLAANLGVPSRIARAVSVAATARPRRIDVGMINGRPFTCMAGAGFDTALISPDARLKQRLGYLAYVYAAVEAGLSPQVASLEITLDGESFIERGVGLEVANLPGLRLPGLPWPINIIRDGSIDDGLLDICILGADSTLSLISVVASFMTGRPHRNPRIRYLRGREVRVEADPPLAVQADGELFGMTPFTASVRKRALAVAVPNA
ncbi:MAG: diacylglycerol kinase family protein [Gemmatimonadota bacterium]